MEMPKDWDFWESPAEKKLTWLRLDVIGAASEFSSPFGNRLTTTYADSSASGRSLCFVEDYITTHVLPCYGNTHTSDSFVGQHTTRMVDEAKRYIKRCMGGGEEDAILFCGSGATAAIKRLQEVIGIAIPSTLRARVLSSDVLRDQERWVVFVGPYEHHSNLLSWRQSLAEVVEIGLTEDGGCVDTEALRAKLELYEPTGRPMLGSFSACSNVTGIVTDTRRIARLLHQYGAFACFDFAASGPYVEIDMRSGDIDGYDAVFVSPHKFIGGPGSPGILLMSKQLYRLASSAPSTCGGGTVSYVNGFNEEDTLYLEDVEERENAGTPPIIQTIRAALAFWVKEYIGYKTIEKQEFDYVSRALERLGGNKNVRILGNTSVKRLPILSFLVFPTASKDRDQPGHDNVGALGERDKPLDGRFVAKLLNDLFGVQARGGCACAGPYGHYLLDVDKAYSLAFRSSIQKGYEGVKPGWTRVSFPYYMSTEEFEFVLTAVEFVASYGHRFLRLYDFGCENGSWVFNEEVFKEALDLNKLERERKRDFDILKLAGFMEELKLRIRASNRKKGKGVAPEEAEGGKNKFSSYLETAMYVASVLVKLPEHRRAQKDLAVDLPFRI